MRSILRVALALSVTMLPLSACGEDEGEANPVSGGYQGGGLPDSGSAGGTAQPDTSRRARPPQPR